MIVIDDILVDQHIIQKPFLCDTAACKGACCTIQGGTGAPLLDEELHSLMEATQHARRYLSTAAQEEIAQHGVYEGTPGEYTTRCINNADCVFVFYEHGIARCALEKAYLDGHSQFRKPLSCHLFPIRVDTTHRPYLYYEQFDECAPAREYGARANVVVAEAVREALIRAFGASWYEHLRDAVQEHRAARNHYQSQL
ncbi:MAG: DUF3109 family protein [Bacteroidota bacterium]|nr:DUF3109 family protein [Candidatus Kapabacteria bacterium]MDW8220234.1 DUF3109 family protein [Bacteroidota bacterium]